MSDRKFTVHSVTIRNAVYLRTDDVSNYLREMSNTEPDRDVRERLSSAAEYIDALGSKQLERQDSRPA